MAKDKPHNIFLIGLMGAGKTSIGRSLAKTLGWTFYDSDQVIEVRSGADITWIFDVEGEVGFREREVDVIDELTQKKNIVLSTGGGTVLRPENREALAGRGLVIYLEASITTLAQRTRYDTTKRPQLLQQNRKRRLQELFLERETFYKTVADLVYKTDESSLTLVCEHILRDLEDLGCKPEEEG